MLPPKVRAVYFKELRDALRDRRTVFALIVIPLVLYPVMLLGTAEVAQMTHAQLAREAHMVAVPEGTHSFFETLNQLAEREPDSEKSAQSESNGLDSARGPALDFREMNLADAENALQAGEVRAVVIIPADVEKRVAKREAVDVEIRFDQAEFRSNDAANRLGTLFERYRTHVINDRLEAQKLERAFLQPFSITRHNVAAAAKVGGSVFGSILPLLFIIMIITGAIHPAIDMTAGEKERSTLETLISAPARPVEIIAGKFLAVATMALGNAILNVGSFAGTFAFLPMPASAQFQMPWSALPLSLLLLLPLALFFAGLLLAVASFAANQKEAQIYCLPVYLVPVLGLTITSLPGIELAGPLLLVPVINTALLIKELFLGHGTAQQIAFVFFSTCLYAAAMVALAARVFAREEVLFSAQGSLRLFLNRRYFRAATLPRPGDSLLVMALLFPLSFYFELGFGKAFFGSAESMTTGGFVALAIMKEAALFLGLPLAVAWYLKLNLKRTFLLNAPPLGALLGALLMGCSAFLIAQQLIAWQSRFWPYPAVNSEALEKMLAPLTKSGSGLALLVFIIGVMPAVCEELAFRGFLQQGLTRSGKWFGIICVGVIFGLFHFPFFKQPVVMLLGVVLAYTAWQTRSIWPGVLLHFCNNSLAIVGPGLLKLPEESTVASAPLPDIPLRLFLPAVGMFFIGLWIVHWSGGKESGDRAIG